MAQSVAHLSCKQVVRGSSPLASSDAEIALTCNDAGRGDSPLVASTVWNGILLTRLLTGVIGSPLVGRVDEAREDGRDLGCLVG